MRKSVFIGCLMAAMCACKSTSYTNNSGHTILWTKDMQTDQGITDDELMDEDNSRLMNQSFLQMKRKLSPEEIAENDKSISPDAGKHFDKGKLIQGGYEYVRVPVNSLGLPMEIVGDTMFIKFSAAQKPILFRFVKNTQRYHGKLCTFYYFLPEQKFKKVRVAGHMERKLEYVAKHRKYLYVRRWVQAHEENRATETYVMFEDQKYVFYHDEEGKQYAKSRLVVDPKYAGDTVIDLEGVPIEE